MASIEPSALGAKGCVEGLHRFAQGGRWSPFKKKGRQYDKTIQPGYRPKENKPNSLCSLENHTTVLTGDGKAAPPLVAGATTFPPMQGALWVLSSVLHDSKGKRRANLPLRGGKGTGFVGKRSDPKIQ